MKLRPSPAEEASTGENRFLNLDDAKAWPRPGSNTRDAELPSRGVNQAGLDTYLDCYPCFLLRALSWVDRILDLADNVGEMSGHCRGFGRPGWQCGAEGACGNESMG